MSTLIRDVLLPSAAAFGLLVGLTIGPARAGQEPANDEPASVVAAALKPEPGEFEVPVPRANPARDTAAASEPAESDGKRCRRVGRIGKTTARHCP
jgi:hypothetical protein